MTRIPIPHNARLLFIGDSITDAFRKPEEINPAYQMGNGFAFLIAARLATDHPASHLEFINRGVSGQVLADVAARWESDCLALRPSLLTMLVGVNETIRAMQGAESLSAEDFVSLYDSLLSRFRQEVPEGAIVLLEPFLLPVGEVNDHWLTHLSQRQAVLPPLAQKHNALFIPLQQIFQGACAQREAAYWAYDGIHPTHAGAELIARAWLQHVEVV